MAACRYGNNSLSLVAKMLLSLIEVGLSVQPRRLGLGLPQLQHDIETSPSIRDHANAYHQPVAKAVVF